MMQVGPQASERGHPGRDFRRSAARFPDPPDVRGAGRARVRFHPFGTLTLPLADLVAEPPEDSRFALPETIRVPLALGFPRHGSLLLEGDAGQAAGAIRAVVLRLLANFPPGRVAFTFIDAVRLGRDHAGLMHLADYEDTLIRNPRDPRLADPRRRLHPRARHPGADGHPHRAPVQ